MAHLKRQISLRLSDEALGILERLAERYGGKQRAIELALARLDAGGEPTNAELAALVAARLGETQ